VSGSQYNQNRNQNRYQNRNINENNKQRNKNYNYNRHNSFNVFNDYNVRSNNDYILNSDYHYTDNQNNNTNINIDNYNKYRNLFQIDKHSIYTLELKKIDINHNMYIIDISDCFQNTQFSINKGAIIPGKQKESNINQIEETLIGNRINIKIMDPANEKFFLTIWMKDDINLDTNSLCTNSSNCVKFENDGFFDFIVDIESVNSNDYLSYGFYRNGNI